MNHKLLTTTTLALCSGLALCAKNDKRPNIIFILADDLGYGDISCYSDQPMVMTPHIDGIAKAGVQMTQAYSSPVSSPTRTTFLTGKFPQRSGVFGNGDGTAPGIGPLRSCFVENLQENGYQTAWFGKWHQGWDVSNHPANNGFDRTYGFLGGMHDYYDPQEGSHYNGGPFSKQAFIFNGFKPVKEIQYLTRELTDQAIAFIDSRKKKDDPFFIYMAYNAPHTPLQAPAELIEKYLRKTADPKHPTRNEMLAATRYAMIDYMDAEIGRILACLDEHHLTQNTMVVFMSDNGAEKQENNGGFRGHKMTMWEGGIRVPLVAQLPGRIPAGSKSSSICSIVDMAATFIGLSQNNNALTYGDGKNLMPYFNGVKKDNVHDNLVFSLQPQYKKDEKITAACFNLLGVRMKDWKLVIDKSRHTDALYNLSENPEETKDLSSRYPEKKAELMKYAEEFIASSCHYSVARYYMRSTREDGDQIKIDSLLQVCNDIVKEMAQ